MQSSRRRQLVVAAPLVIDWFHNRFSPAATSWGHSKCRGRLARDGPSPRVAAVRLGPWVQSEAPRLSLGRGGEPRAHSVPRSRIFPRPHSSDIADTTLPHALTLLLLGYSSETWWQSRLASSTRRFAQVRARPCHRSPPRRHARAPLSGETHSRANSRTQTNARARRSRDRNAAPRRAHRTQRRLPVGRLAGSRIGHCAAGVWRSWLGSPISRAVPIGVRGSAVAGSMCPAFNVPRWHAGRVSLPRREVSAPAGHNVSVLARPRGK